MKRTIDLLNYEVRQQINVALAAEDKLSKYPNMNENWHKDFKRQIASAKSFTEELQKAIQILTNL